MLFSQFMVLMFFKNATIYNSHKKGGFVYNIIVLTSGLTGLIELLWLRWVTWKTETIFCLGMPILV